MHEEGFLINKKSGLGNHLLYHHVIYRELSTIYTTVIDIRGGNIEREKLIIQYARKPGLAHNQRWSYQNGYIFPSSAPHLVLDIRV